MTIESMNTIAESFRKDHSFPSLIVNILETKSSMQQMEIYAHANNAISRAGNATYNSRELLYKVSTTLNFLIEQSYIVNINNDYKLL